MNWQDDRLSRRLTFSPEETEAVYAILSEIDAVKNTIQLLIEDAEYQARMAAFEPSGPGATRGVLGKYAATVATASEGAVTDKNL